MSHFFHLLFYQEACFLLNVSIQINFFISRLFMKTKNTSVRASINLKWKMKLFNKYRFDNIKLNNLSLSEYINISYRYGLIQPHSSASYNRKPFKKMYCPIVERLVNSLMMKGRNTGKKIKSIQIVEKCFSVIYLITGLNPIIVLIRAIINSAPLEDSIVIGSKKSKKRISVDISPYKRVSIALYLITSGVRKISFKNIRPTSELLAEELVNAFKNSSNSYAIRKKLEIERIAEKNR
mmetsp:Transcript_15386/g.24353  ORF Transcript_15386/g.24353 Transcript_15386/m.24353 type:complete len:237 (+) Transcript_15386:546-1256(+)